MKKLGSESEISSHSRSVPTALILAICVFNEFTIVSLAGDLVAVYTPETNITSYEIISSGHFVVLAMEGTSNLITLQLRGSVETEEKYDETYGDPENKGKTFQLQEC